MGEIIPGVDPREKMAADYWTKTAHFQTVAKWQTLFIHTSGGMYETKVKGN